MTNSHPTLGLDGLPRVGERVTWTEVFGAHGAHGEVVAVDRSEGLERPMLRIEVDSPDWLRGEQVMVDPEDVEVGR